MDRAGVEAMRIALPNYSLWRCSSIPLFTLWTLPRVSGRIGSKIVRNYNLLWGLWAIWGLLVAGWLLEIHMDLPALFYGKALAVVLGLVLSALLVLFYKTKRNRSMSSFNENKNPLAASQDTDERDFGVESLRPVNAEKDTVISQGAQIAGEVKSAGNITVEGHVTGDLYCENTIKIENMGKVIGEIKSQKIVIDGYVDGRLEACSVSVLARGKVVGDIFSDELSIEKGGVFNGQANPLPVQNPAWNDDPQDASPGADAFRGVEAG